MTHFQKALEDARTFELRDSNGKINQTDRNKLRAMFMAALLLDMGLVMTVEGLIGAFEHEYWGQLFIELNVKMKDPDFDLDTAIMEYQEKMAKAEAKRIEAEQKAAERAAKVATKKNPE